MLTAWGAAGVVGPTLIAQVRQTTGQYQGALRIMALITLLSAIAPLVLHPPVLRRVPSESQSDLANVSRRIAS